MTNRFAPTTVLSILRAYVGSLVGVELLLLLLVSVGPLQLDAIRHHHGAGVAHLVQQGLRFVCTSIGWFRLGLFLMLVHETTRFAKNRGIFVKASPNLAAVAVLVPFFNAYALYVHLTDIVRRSAMRESAADAEGIDLRNCIVLYALVLAFETVLFVLPVPSGLETVRFVIGWFFSVPIGVVTFVVWKKLVQRIAAYHGRAGEGPAFA